MTPGGKLSKGDVLVHDKLPGVRFEVVRRHGETEVYSVTLKAFGPVPDGAMLPRHMYGDPPGTIRLIEAHYWVFMAVGGWALAREAVHA